MVNILPQIYLSALFFLLSPSIFSAPISPPDSLTRQPARQGVTLQIGTTGPGLLYSYELSRSRRLTVRVGGQYIAYQKPISLKASSDGYITIQPDITIGIAQANLKWHPFRRSTFFLTGGVGYTWHPSMNFVITADNTLDLDGLVLTPEDVGTVNLGFRWKPILGYLGWGFGRSIPRKRFGVGFEMGVFYIGKPKVELAYEGFLETTTIDQQVPIVEQNLANYRYLPSLNLTLSYRLTR